MLNTSFVILPFLRYFVLPTDGLKNIEGKLLVADLFLQDPYFSRSVVLLTEVNEEGRGRI